MWIYEQSSGRLSRNGSLVGTGYSGIGDGKNNPAMQDAHDVGPIPQGNYTMGTAINSPTHGPCAIPLTPDPANQMFGRSEFLVHGDSLEHPGQASHGCVIMARAVRDQLVASSDKLLNVVAGAGAGA
jgi:hypothetical protein